ncbi:MAG: hypothetical protein KGL39_51220 [Patescibacteria group bacterium]|nr:hypothetical protein [Patescibacteria group bacterium]
MVDTLPPFPPAELADLKAKAKAASETAAALGKAGNYIPENIYDAAIFAGGEYQIAATPNATLRLIDMIERRDAVVIAAREVVEDRLLADAIEHPMISIISADSATAKLIRLREAIVATESTK